MTSTDTLEALAMWRLTEQGRMELARRVWDGTAALSVVEDGSLYAVLAGDEVVCHVRADVLHFLAGHGAAQRNEN